MHIVLVEPEIPPNTGNIARLCASTGTTLHLIEPLGFTIDDKQLARAGMDYWKLVQWQRWPSWIQFQFALPAAARLWFIESGGPRNYAEVNYTMTDYLVFGRETAGLPASLVEEHHDHWLRIPMTDTGARSLNLSNCAAIVLFEALRQSGFRGLV